MEVNDGKKISLNLLYKTVALFCNSNSALTIHKKYF